MYTYIYIILYNFFSFFFFFFLYAAVVSPKATQVATGTHSTLRIYRIYDRAHIYTPTVYRVVRGL